MKCNLSRHNKWEKALGFDWPAWQALKLRELRRFKRENRKIIKEYAEVISRETAQLLSEQFSEGCADVAHEILGFFDSEFSDETEGDRQSDTQFFGVDKRKLNALLNDTQRLESRATSAALRMTDDVYRSAINRAEIAMTMGAATLPQAIDMAMEDFLKAGITCIQYKDGRRINIADYAQMALRTASARAKLQGEAAMRAELGIDTVCTSQYGGCSETCLPWQGKPYIDDVFADWKGERNGDFGTSRDGDQYLLLSVAVEAGLFHPNCRHTLYSWRKGISKMPPPLDADKIRKTNALEQKQRSLEREIRKWKRMETGALAPKNQKEYTQKRKEAQKELNAFVKAHSVELRRDPWREKVYLDEDSNIMKLMNIRPTRTSIGRGSDINDPEELRREFLIQLGEYEDIPEPIYKVYKLFGETAIIERNYALNAAFGFVHDEYNPRIMFNPTHSDYKHIDTLFGLSHEIMHMYDMIWVDTSNSMEWENLLTRCDLNDIVVDVKYWEAQKSTLSAPLSDILSALTIGKIGLDFGHSGEYYRLFGKRTREIFTNLAMCYAFVPEDVSILKKYFPDICEVFETTMGV